MDVKKIKKLLFILIVSIISFNIETVNAENTESVCKANTNTDYEKICLYHTVGEENVSLVTYIGDNSFVVKADNSNINDSELSSMLPAELTVNNTKGANNANLYISVLTTIPSDYKLCPPIIKLYYATYSISSAGYGGTSSRYKSYLFGIADPNGMAIDFPIIKQYQENNAAYSTKELFYLSDNGGVRDAKTCKVVDQNAFPSADDFDSEDCSQLIDEELMGMINKVLKYIRIIVPILVIVLGMVDFGRAVLAGKEDGMKKAQATFIKRIIIGVAIFLLPTLINLVLNLANTVWKNGLFNNSNCGIK